MANTIVPCVWMDGGAEAAAELYTRLFPGGRRIAVSHYPEAMDNPGGRPRGSVLTLELELGGQRFTLLEGGPIFRPNPSISFFVHVDAAAEADRLFGTLAEGGQVLMALDAYPWSPRYGWVQDRFGVSWQVLAGRRPPRGVAVSTCLMFAGPQRGRALEAMRHYTGIFPDSHLGDVERYGAGEGPAGGVKHGRVVLAGQDLVAMDSHVAHGVTFDEGLSLQVTCRDQSEVDHYWTALSAGGSEGPCGWLKDRFGLSWQVVPAQVSGWMSSRDVRGRDRCFAAIMQMRKPDVAALERAFAGR